MQEHQGSKSIAILPGWFSMTYKLRATSLTLMEETIWSPRFLSKKSKSRMVSELLFGIKLLLFTSSSSCYRPSVFTIRAWMKQPWLTAKIVLPRQVSDRAISLNFCTVALALARQSSHVSMWSSLNQPSSVTTSACSSLISRSGRISKICDRVSPGYGTRLRWMPVISWMSGIT